MNTARIGAFAAGNKSGLTVLLSLVSLYFFAYFQRVGIPGTIFDELQTDLGLSASGVALLGAIYLYIYGGMQLVVGLMADHYGFGRVFLTGSLCLCLGSLAFPLLHAPPALYAMRAFVGLGCSMLFVSMVKGIDRLFAPRHFAMLLGIAQFGGFWGGLFATYPLAALTRDIGWRNALLIVAGATIVCTAVLAWVLGRHRLLSQPPPAAVSRRMLGTVLRNRAFHVLIVAGTLNFSIYFVAQATIGKKLLADCFGMGTGPAAAFMFLMMLTCMTGTFASGFLLRLCRHTFRPLLLGAAILTCIACAGMVAVLTWRGAPVWAVILFYLMLAVASSAGVIYTAAVKMLCPPEAVGTAVGLGNGVTYIVLALLAHFAGIVLDLFRAGAVRTSTAVIYPPEAYRMFFILCMGLCGVLILVLSRFREPPKPAAEPGAEPAPVFPSPG